MLQYSRWQLLGILGIFLVALILCAPNFVPKDQRDQLPAFVPKSFINLGLDLQGGSYLLLGVKTDKVISDRLANTRNAGLTSLRPSGGKARIAIANQPTVNQRDRTIAFRIRDPQQVADAEKRIHDAVVGVFALGGLPPYEVKSEGQVVLVKMTEQAEKKYKQEALAQSIEIVRRRIDPAGNKEVSIQPNGEDRIVIQAPGETDPEGMKAIIGRTGQLTFHRVDQTADVQSAANGAIPPGRIYVPMSPDEATGLPGLVLYAEPEITGTMVKSASAGLNQDGGGFQINFAFDNTGALRFGEFTRQHVGELFAIVLDNQIISAPRIQTPITGGSGRITGSFSSEEATRVSTLIRSGALPAPLETLEQRTVGPGLGADSIRAGTISMLFGFLGVAIYMIVTYGRFGVYAVIALFGNLILNTGVLAMLGSTLTLPGIAGIVLTIGMAVDANVLIFERTREELRAGKTVSSAVSLGFDKAWTAILDTHVTAFATALTMFMLGAGPVRGFAVTLATGVITSVFSAIVVTKILAAQYVMTRRPKTLVI
ncbi:MAG: protein translocase subunit SecD [Parvularculaceae bacterium]|nr:protein translocase subunit SecD [Parvularculaceae bacterium]